MKKKKDKLTNIEKRLLMYPPTEDTWICNNCKIVVNGKYNICMWCRTEQPEGFKLVLPTYLTACEKVGIIPFSCKWKTKEGTTIPIVFPKDGTKWILQEEWKPELN